MMRTAQFGRAIFGRILFAAGVLKIIPYNPAVAPPARTFYVPQDGRSWEGRKTPEERINFSFNWEDFIPDDPIVSSSWSFNTSDLTYIADGLDASGYITTILLKDGIFVNSYEVTNLIVTESGLILDATFRLYVNQYNT